MNWYGVGPRLWPWARNQEKLRGLPPEVEQKVVDAADAAALGDALGGCRAVVNCVGSCVDLGEAVVAAALAARALGRAPETVEVAYRLAGARPSRGSCAPTCGAPPCPATSGRTALWEKSGYGEGARRRSRISSIPMTAMRMAVSLTP